MIKMVNNDNIEKHTKTKFDSFLVNEPKIIKDTDTFKNNTPPNIVERKETIELYRELSIFLNYSKPNHLLILGFPGSGKTVSVNFALRIIKDRKPKLRTININCYGKSSLEILNEINNSKGRTSEKLLSFLKSLESDCILVLDEIDRSERISDLLYGISRPKEIFPEFNHNINFILISNNISWEENIQDRIRSSLQLKKIIFTPYKGTDMRNILNQRIKRGFVDKSVISNELVNYISDYVVEKRRSDCRFAIETLFYSGLNAEKGNKKVISKEDVENAIKNTTDNINRLMVGKLDDSQLITLFAISSSEKGLETIDQLHKIYTDIIINNKISVKPKGRVMVFHMLNCLDNLGLVEKNNETIKKDNNTYRVVHLNSKIPNDIVLNELTIRGLRLLK